MVKHMQDVSAIMYQIELNVANEWTEKKSRFQSIPPNSQFKLGRIESEHPLWKLELERRSPSHSGGTHGTLFQKKYVR